MKIHWNLVTSLSALFLAANVNLAGAAELMLSKGQFHDAGRYTTSGSVGLFRLDNGTYELRFGDDFSSTKGPDLFVYLSTAADPKDDAAIEKSAFVDAGLLGSLTGSRRYKLPANYDPDKFKSVAIWCKKFGVLFGAAPLMSQ